ncbi:hypothetical protein [Herbidospora sp. RD11066]
MKLDPARLREPAAWLLMAAAAATVLVAVFRLFFSGSSSSGGTIEFGMRAITGLTTLTSPVNTALAVGAVLLCTKLGAPTPKSRLITMGAAGTLALAVLVGAISLLGVLFNGLGFGDKLRYLLPGIPTFALAGLALVFLLTMVSPAAAAGAARPKKSRRLSSVPAVIPFPQTGDAHAAPDYQDYPVEQDYSSYPQGPVFDQNGYAGQQVAEEPPLEPVKPQPERYSYPEPVYNDDDAPAAWDSSPFSGFSGPQYARQAYEAPALEEAAPRRARPAIETPFDSSVREVAFGSQERESGYEAPAREKAYEAPAREVTPIRETAYETPARESSVRDSVYDTPAYEPPVREATYESSGRDSVYGTPARETTYEGTRRDSSYDGTYAPPPPPVYGAPYEPGYEGDIREQQLAQAYQQAQSYQQQPPAYRQSNPFGYSQAGPPAQPPVQPQRYQGDPLSDPLLPEDLIDPIDPVAIYRPAKSGEGLPVDPASTDSDVTARWYSPDRRDR